MEKLESHYNFLQIIGQNIKRIRTLKGFSQEYVADSINKSVNFISLVENGKTGFSIQTLIDLCKLFEIDPNTIFDGIIFPNISSTNVFIEKTLNMFDEKDKSIVTTLISYIINSKK